MAADRIQFDDKVKFQDLALPEVNKLTATNMNEIKSVFANHADLIDGLTTVSIQYLDLVNLKDSNLLVEGTFYKINNFRTKHIIQNSANILNTGSSEPLIVLATSINKFDIQAYSTIYPNDTIEYDFDDNLCEDGITDRNGKIIYRKDNYKLLSTHYDWRAVKNVLYNNYSFVYSSGSKDNDDLFSATIIYGTVDAVPSRYREYYVLIPGVTHNAGVELSLTKTNTVQRQMVKEGGIPFAADELITYLDGGLALVYYSQIYDAYVVKNNTAENNSIVGYHSFINHLSGEYTAGNGTPILLSPENIEVYTFGNQSDGGLLTNISIGKHSSYNNITFLQNNANIKNVHIGNNSYDIVFSSATCHTIDIGDDCHSIQALTDISWSKFDDEAFNLLLAGNSALRYIRTTGEFYNMSFIGSGSVFYLRFQNYGYSNTFRLSAGVGCTFSGVLQNNFLNLKSGFTRTNIIGDVYNKSTEFGVVWNNATICNLSSTLEHLTESKVNLSEQGLIQKYTNDPTVDPEFDDLAIPNVGYVNERTYLTQPKPSIPLIADATDLPSVIARCNEIISLLNSFNFFT